ncbi:MAG: ribonuclease [Betaproteobacteria bacterium]|nr:ribonuclease [Betaproteobacteria bacterium]
MRFVALLLALAVACPAAAFSRIGEVRVAELPPEARATLRLIRSGGPFSHAKDGAVFGNRETLLPKRPRGYYREYTVKTPGSRDRGARRIVAGEGRDGEGRHYYYSEDHYRSFRLVIE